MSRFKGENTKKRDRKLAKLGLSKAFIFLQVAIFFKKTTKFILSLLAFFSSLFYEVSSFAQDSLYSLSCKELFGEKTISIKNLIQSKITNDIQAKRQFISQYGDLSGYLKLSKEIAGDEGDMDQIFKNVLERLTAEEFALLGWGGPFDGNPKQFEYLRTGLLHNGNLRTNEKGEIVFVFPKEEVLNPIKIWGEMGFELWTRMIFYSSFQNQDLENYKKIIREKAISASIALLTKDQF